MTANLKALAKASADSSAGLAVDDPAKRKAKAKAKVNREIGEKTSFLKASMKLFAHVFIITSALVTTDWVFNNGLQTQLIYRGAGPNLVVVIKNKAYHINAFVKQNFTF
jgi:hypothetical protein